MVKTRPLGSGLVLLGGLLAAAFLAAICVQLLNLYEPDGQHNVLASPNARCSGLDSDRVAICERFVQHSRPDMALIDRVEARLATNECVGNLNRWDRIYSFAGSSREGRVDEATVDFALREVGRFGFVRGRQVTYPDSWLIQDDRPFRAVLGHYDRRSGQLVIEFCGSNVAGGVVRASAPAGN